MRAISGACVDTGRATRCGYGEVIYGEGKPAELILEIARELASSQPEVLVTRVERAAAAHVLGEFPHHEHCESARTLRVSHHPLRSWQDEDTPSVTVVSAGSTDRPIALEACQTLAWMGIRHNLREDLGVAGPQRLLAAVPKLRQCRVIIVAAGMEGALPSVVAGHVDCPVIGLPTSVGYGAALGGMTAMLGMLTSCAAGVAVVNIDGGFKAGYLAGLIAGSDRASETSQPE